MHLQTSFLGLIIMVVGGISHAAVNDQARYYNTLCKIYNFARLEPRVTAVTTTEKYVRREFNLILAFSNASDSEYEGLASSNPGFATQYPRIAENEERAKFITLLASLRKQMEELEAIFAGQLKDVEGDAPQSIKTLLKRALFGKMATATTVEASEESFAAATYTDACGAGRTGSRHPGFSLVNDLTCLCGGSSTQQGSTNSKRCASDLETNLRASTNQWDSKASAKAAWTTIKANCEARKIQENFTTPEGIHAHLVGFHALIGAGVGTNDGEQYVYGKVSGDGCTGEENKNCVNYKKQILQLDGSGGIEWEKHLLQAASKMSEGERKAGRLVATVDRMENLLFLAKNKYRIAAGLEVELTEEALKGSRRPGEARSAAFRHSSTKGAWNPFHYNVAESLISLNLLFV